MNQKQQMPPQSGLSKISRRDFVTAASATGLLSLMPETALAEAARLPAQAWSHSEALDAVIDDAVGSGRIVGATVVAARNGKIVYERAEGFSDRESRRPVVIDDVFRLASMTKPIVCVTALALIDAGKLSLDAPVTNWLPEFRPKLADGREPIISIRHLLTHTAGLSYGFLEPEDGPYHRLKVSDGLDISGLSLQENVARIGSAPLLFEPGSAWHYSVAIDVLGAVIEQATGTSLPEAVRTIVTGPLGIESVRFVASVDRPPVTPYGDGSPAPVRMTEPFTLKFGRSGIVYAPARAFDATAFPSGGVGMVGTAHDYLRFLEAIRTGGGGVIRPDTVTAMTSNAIGDLPVTAGPGYGWGWGFRSCWTRPRRTRPFRPAHGAGQASMAQISGSIR
ncbi:MAG TPA: serine hydrolase domain-containing protein [Rhizobium sp.]